MLLYIAGPYRGNITENIAKARKIAIEIWESGNIAICPHLNTANFEEDSLLSDEVYLSGDLQILFRCDGIIMIPGWENSQGASHEKKIAEELNIPVFYYPQIPTPHPTEMNSPVQCESFMNTIMKMYRIHLDKNADYSPANILGTGEIGGVVRLWDKIARIMNLCGFNIEVRLRYFDASKEPKNESLEDSFIDAANYSIINLLLRRNQWGK